MNAPEINPGLGELNLLFIAAELLLLKDDTDGGLKLYRNKKKKIVSMAHSFRKMQGTLYVVGIQLM